MHKVGFPGFNGVDRPNPRTSASAPVPPWVRQCGEVHYVHISYEIFAVLDRPYNSSIKMKILMKLSRLF